MDKNSRQFILLIISITIVLAFIGAGVSLYATIISYRSDIAQISGEIDKVSHQEAGAKELMQILKETEVPRNNLTAYFVADDKIVDFITVLESTGTKNGVQADIVDLNAEDSTGKPKGTINSATIRLEVRGSWVNILRYIMSVERLPYILAVNNLSLRSAGRSTDSSVGSVKTQGTTQWVANFAVTIKKIL